MSNQADTQLLTRLGRNRDLSRRFRTTTQNVSRWKRLGIPHPWRDYLSLIAFLEDKHPGVLEGYEAMQGARNEAA